ncbi:exported hypothetical protein [Thiomonas arsenitoxydans]|nr:exported hypothetical protein [Thiomonas arsenitoxydans]
MQIPLKNFIVGFILPFYSSTSLIAQDLLPCTPKTSQQAPPHRSPASPWANWRAICLVPPPCSGATGWTSAAVAT